jgi:hypothetical protein
MIKYELIYIKLTTCSKCKKFNENQNFPALELMLKENKVKYPFEIKIADENVKSSGDSDLIKKTEMVMKSEDSFKVPALFLFYDQSTKTQNISSGQSLLPETNISSGQSLLPETNISSGQSLLPETNISSGQSLLPETNISSITEPKFIKIDIQTGYNENNNQRDINGILSQIEKSINIINKPDYKNPSLLKKYIKYKYKYLVLKNKYLQKK